MLDEKDYIKFIASLPPIQSAIQISGMEDGAIIKLEIPQSEIESIIKLSSLTKTIFEVIIIPLDKKVINKKIRFLKDVENEQTKTDSSQTLGRESRTSSIKQKRTKTKKK